RGRRREDATVSELNVVSRGCMKGPRCREYGVAAEDDSVGIDEPETGSGYQGVERPIDERRLLEREGACAARDPAYDVRDGTAASRRRERHTFLLRTHLAARRRTRPQYVEYAEGVKEIRAHRLPDVTVYRDRRSGQRRSRALEHNFRAHRREIGNEQ